MFPYVRGVKETKQTYYVSHKTLNPPEAKHFSVCFGGFSFAFSHLPLALLLHEADYLMAVEAPVTLARDMNPEYPAVHGLKDELVEVGVVSQPLHPVSRQLYVGET